MFNNGLCTASISFTYFLLLFRNFPTKCVVFSGLCDSVAVPVRFSPGVRFNFQPPATVHLCRLPDRFPSRRCRHRYRHRQIDDDDDDDDDVLSVSYLKGSERLHNVQGSLRLEPCVVAARDTGPSDLREVLFLRLGPVYTEHRHHYFRVARDMTD